MTHDGLKKIIVSSRCLFCYFKRLGHDAKSNIYPQNSVNVVKYRIAYSFHSSTFLKLMMLIFQKGLDIGIRKPTL